MSLPAFLKTCDQGVCLSVKVQPRASKTEIGESVGGELKVKVRALPVDSAANEAVLRLLAETFSCPRSSIQLIRGSTSRHKQIRILGITPEKIISRLQSGK